MNNDLSTEKRIILAVVISMGFLFAYPYIVKWINPPAPPAVTDAVKKLPETLADAVKAEVSAADSKKTPAKPQINPVFSTVETPLWKAVFTSKGGAIKSWELKKYASTLEPGAAHVNLTGSVIANGSLDTSIKHENSLEEIVFSASSSETLLVDTETKDLVFTGKTAAGVRVEKRYRFNGQAYLSDLQVTVQNPTRQNFSARAVTTLVTGNVGKDASGYHSGPLVSAKDKILRPDEDDSDESGENTLKWIGMEDKYFLAAVIPPAAAPVSWRTHTAGTARGTAVVESALNVAPGGTASFNYGVFMGPKEYDLLLTQKNGIEEAIEFGMFAFMAKPSLVVLNFFKRYLVNYGLAIILFTVILKIVFYPLTKHSLMSMRDMAKIQPQLVYLKEKYKDDKAQLNKEMMDLYKRYKINPVGGCLPMVLQIPVFIALYEVLYVAIELRHAPLGLWIQDLAAMDPYYITPLVMGATMFIQQKMTPTTADPMQAKIMMFMPIVFTFMFLKFPAGLVIYWLVNNVLSIAQQYWIQRTPAKA